MQTPTAGMVELAEVTKQYKEGLVTFSEFIMKVMLHAVDTQTVDQLLELNRAEYREMIEFEQQLGL